MGSMIRAYAASLQPFRCFQASALVVGIDDSTLIGWIFRLAKVLYCMTWQNTELCRQVLHLSLTHEDVVRVVGSQVIDASSSSKSKLLHLWTQGQA